MSWYVYIMSNKAHTLYTGMTSDLRRRVEEHKTKKYANAFTARYTFDRLVYYEPAADQHAAAVREKRIKNWTRARRIALIQSMNANWNDLSRKWDLARLIR